MTALNERNEKQIARGMHHATTKYSYIVPSHFRFASTKLESRYFEK